ncbi:heterokaryon incompatibility protein-domain-containing protein [Xylaria sp. FL0043]|nr:heterokaryon incompatibility protein-domain-containing protein [Xylaria sp. FL0043]
MRDGGQMKALKGPRIFKFFQLKYAQLKSVFRSSNRKAETNSPSTSPPPSQGPADSLTPPGDSPSDSVLSSDLSSVSEDNEAAGLGSQLHASRSDEEAAAIESLLHLANSDDDVAGLRSLFRELRSTFEVSEVKSMLLGMCANSDAFKTELSHVCRVVVGILQDLCRRDSRFIYLQKAMAEFLDENFDLRIRLSYYNHLTGSDVSDNSYEHLTAIGIDLDFLSQIKDRNVLRYRLSQLVPVAEILLAVIYEILDVFDFDIAPQESFVQKKIPAYLTVLHRLYDKTKSCEPKPRKQATCTLENRQSNSHFIYQTELDPATDQIRILRLNPGSEDDDIDCSLEVHSIKEDGIPEALSYVWGKELSREQILVDLQPFSISRDLLEILRSLRHPKTPRTIWIDAICINQTNNKERTCQVRLMREIYSQAQKTIIYLTKADLRVIQSDQYIPPLPENFGGTTIDQFDLESIVREFQEYPNDAETPWCERQLALFVMMSAWCMPHIFSCAWWERIWTLQEGALARSPPIVLFQGHSFTFQTLQSALKIQHDVKNLSEDQCSHLFTPILHNRSKDERTREICRTLDFLADNGFGAFIEPLLVHLRQQHSDDTTAGDLYNLLNKTAGYRATDPRDKIYALESLLPCCIGKLIRIDYNEGYETTFTCATARCINSRQLYNLAVTYDLLIDSTTIINKSSAVADDEANTHPSWVLDFSYSDSDVHSNIVASNIGNSMVTLSGFLLHNAYKIQEFQRKALNPMFATPTTLFCDGIKVGEIDETGIIAEEGDPDLFDSVSRLATQIHQRIQGAQANSGIGLNTVMLFFCLHLETDSGPERKGRDFFAIRLKEIVGKRYFITKNGLLGIATAPVRQGDSLCLLDSVCVYFVLRAVPDSEPESQGSSLKETQRHRIVARAAVRGVNLPSPMASFPPRRFQII